MGNNSSKYLKKEDGELISASKIITPPLPSGAWFAPHQNSFPNTTGIFATGTMFFRSIIIPDDITINGILVNVSTNATPTTGAVIALSLYSLSYSVGVPTANKVTDLGTLGIELAGVSSASISNTTIKSGYYLLGYQHNNAAAVTFSVVPNYALPQIPSSTLLNRVNCELTKTQTYTYPAPSTVSSFTSENNGNGLHVKFLIA